MAAVKDTTTGTGPLNEGELRRRSVGTVEITDGRGRRRTVQLDELNEADRALAAQFGYKPVRDSIRAVHRSPS